jgi:hypothetical protein
MDVTNEVEFTSHPLEDYLVKTLSSVPHLITSLTFPNGEKGIFIHVTGDQVWVFDSTGCWEVRNGKPGEVSLDLEDIWNGSNPFLQMVVSSLVSWKSGIFDEFPINHPRFPWSSLSIEKSHDILGDPSKGTMWCVGHKPDHRGMGQMN